MKAHFCHFNFNVLDLERSMAFYEEALDLREIHRISLSSAILRASFLLIIPNCVPSVLTTLISLARIC